MAKANHSEFFDSKPFLKGTDIKKDTQVTVEAFDKVKTRISEKPRPCLRLKGFEAPLGLNVTNFNRMIEKFGDDTDNWIGKRITLKRVLVNNPQTKQEQAAIRIQ